MSFINYTDIAETLESKLKSIFSDSVFLQVRVVHDDKDLVVRSHHREILTSILDYLHANYDLTGFFKESLYGKIIIFSVKDFINIYKKIEFPNLLLYYKSNFFNRIKIIENKLNKNKPTGYLELKDKFYKLFNEENIDINQYLEVRAEFEEMRYK